MQKYSISHINSNKQDHNEEGAFNFSVRQSINKTCLKTGQWFSKEYYCYFEFFFLKKY